MIDAMLLGSIPVIVDWQAHSLNNILDGVIFWRHRLEDVVVVLDAAEVDRSAEYVVYVALAMVQSGEAARRQARLREVVDMLVYRQDRGCVDAWTTLFGVLLQRRAYLEMGRAQPWRRVRWSGGSETFGDLTGVWEDGGGVGAGA